MNKIKSEQAEKKEEVKRQQQQSETMKSNESYFGMVVEEINSPSKLMYKHTYFQALCDKFHSFVVLRMSHSLSSNCNKQTYESEMELMK